MPSPKSLSWNALKTELLRLVDSSREVDRTALLICLWAPVALTLVEYRFIPANAVWASSRALLALAPFAGNLSPYVWWVGGVLGLLVVIPAALLWLAAGTRPSAVGLRISGTAKDAGIYLWLYLVFLPILVVVSRDPAFHRIYPMFHPTQGAASGEFVAFELLYFLQFLAVEFFFRGLLVLGLKPSIGRYSILVALAPYCMIHYHKPLPEALGAIGAGVILGSLAWQAETIVYGWFLHYAVALTMDLLALKGGVG